MANNVVQVTEVVSGQVIGIQEDVMAYAFYKNGAVITRVDPLSGNRSDIRVAEGLISDSQAIAGVDTALEQFELAGDLRSQYGKGTLITVSGSTGNDGAFTLAVDPVFDGTNTILTMVEDVTDATVNGNIDYTNDIKTLSTVMLDILDGELILSMINVEKVFDVADVPSAGGASVRYGAGGAQKNKITITSAPSATPITTAVGYNTAANAL